MVTSSNNHSYQGPDFTYGLRQSLSNAFDCAPVTSTQFTPPLDVSWPTNFRELPSRGVVSPTQAPQNHYRKPDTSRSPPGFSSEEPSSATYHIKPTCLLPDHNGADTYFVNRGRGPSFDWQRDPRAMRKCLMLQAEGKPLTETFRKSAKDIVASPNARKASSARRKHAARFKCPIDGCNDDFTRKHNLDSE